MHKNKDKINISSKFIIYTFLISISSSFVALLLGYILSTAGFIKQIRYRPLLVLFLFFLASIIIGVIVYFIVSKKNVKEVNTILNAVNKIGKGDFSVDLDYEYTMLGEIANNINLMALELKNLEIMRNDFIQSFSHEFKTPIVSIQGFAQRLLTKNLSEKEVKEYLEIIYEEANRLSKLSENTLFLAKLENYPHKLNVSSFKIKQLLNHVIKLFEKKVISKNITVDLNIIDIDLFSDEELVKQLYINLISNAIKFSKDNSKIVISVISYNDKIITTISDTGIGMSEDTLNRMYKKYYQEDTSRKTEGFGLGLSIVSKILELINGSIECSSQIGIGTTFTVVLTNYINYD